ncbi:hypothetical protein GYMLUDRAFT_250011 [Collybiopsis luxurians FD-317 M1]|uniref:Uncharacterized protein n=1 Tax=Collybiopsis luxurians FD-317 M1 TaxID=944289 RepID=A0A0D0BVZ1_9AGAR|nr:hypothetical protein GYMLUDRAFT_250011 [Collybiopsis luxurians FD-317 M1]
MSQVEDSALQHASFPAPSDGGSCIHLTTVHPAQPSISTAHIATTAKAAPSGSFITPAVPPPSQSTYTQRADHFATVPTVNDDGKNFTIFCVRWEVAVSATGISHLFDPNYVPPTYPHKLDDIDYAAALPPMNKLPESHLECWEEIIEFPEEDEKLVKEICNAGSEVTDSEQCSHVLKIIPWEYKEHIDSVLSIACIARITILMPDLIHNLKDHWWYLNPNSKSSNTTSKPKNPDAFC